MVKLSSKGFFFFWQATYVSRADCTTSPGVQFFTSVVEEKSLSWPLLRGGTNRFRSIRPCPKGFFSKATSGWRFLHRISSCSCWIFNMTFKLAHLCLVTLVTNWPVFTIWKEAKSQTTQTTYFVRVCLLAPISCLTHFLKVLIALHGLKKYSPDLPFWLLLFLSLSNKLYTLYFIFFSLPSTPAAMLNTVTPKNNCIHLHRLLCT